MRLMQDIDITVEGKVLSHVYAGERLADVLPYIEKYPSVFVVSDENVGKAAEFLTRQENIVAMASLKATEEEKDISTVMAICRWLLECGADREALLLAIGGGITTDIAGFAASIYKRGIRFAYIPTTLLAQVDAAVGGKTGVNFQDYKNMIGVIRQPDFTFECAEVLETLPVRDFRSGAAEMLKTFIIENKNGSYARAVRLLSARYTDGAELTELIAAAAAVKAGVVSRDQFENGERRKLNLGHTFAHAIEWAAHSGEKTIAEADGSSTSVWGANDAATGGENVTHGEAVAIGTVLAARLSEKMGLCEKGLAARIEGDFLSCGLPTESPYPLGILAAAMHKDKKAEGNKIHFVLIKAIGDVVIEDMSPEDAIGKLI